MLRDDQIDIRCDRLTCDNKGGVLICVPRRMNPTHVQRFGIEALSTTIHIQNLGKLKIAVVYRSPRILQATLISILHRLLRHVSMSNLPCIILGDFNEDILRHQNSALLSLMSNFTFTQLVQSPTTAQGTLIDHVYYRNPTLCIYVPLFKSNIYTIPIMTQIAKF